MSTAESNTRFEDHCRDAVRDLRGALLDLYAQVGADPDRPQDVSRLLRLNKNLTWKISRVLQTEEALQALPLLPGAAGLDLVLDATERAGASNESLQRTRRAIAEIDAMIATHGGDRATMDLMLDSMAQTGLEKSRKMAFRGNAGLWGVMAKSRMSAQIIAPSASDPAMLDVLLLVGLQRVRRLRSIPRWPVFRLARYEFEGEERRFAVEDAGDAPWGFLPSFSRGPMPEIFTSEQGQEITYEIGDGPIGKTGEFGCYFGFGYRRDVPRYASEADDSAWLAAAVNMPVETLLFDLFVHKDMPEALEAQTGIYGGSWQFAPEFADSSRLPLHDQPVHLGLGADLSTPLADQYATVVHRSFESAGWSAGDFHCLRLVVEHPPMPSWAVIRYRLPERPA